MSPAICSQPLRIMEFASYPASEVKGSTPGNVVSEQIRLYGEVANLRTPQLGHGGQDNKSRRC